MKDTMGLILTEDVDLKMRELTEFRTVSALPIAGRYRLIDFILSNIVNSGIINVGVTTRYNYSSLMEHLGSGAPWDLQRNNLGLITLPPFVNLDSFGEGTVDTLMGILPFLKRSRQKYVLISEANTVFNTTFYELLKFHKDNRADITVMYSKISDKEKLSRSNVLEIDENSRLYGYGKCPRAAATQNASMNIYLMERQLLMKLVEDSVSRGEHDFIMESIVKKLNSLRIYCYRYKGYVGRVDCSASYFSANMDMLNEEVRGEIFGSGKKIFTRVQNQVPTSYGEGAEVSDSLIADGCSIDGKLESCVVFRGVRLCKGVHVRNSVLMERTFIGENCDLDYVVLDKECVVREGVRLHGQNSYPILVGKGSII